MVGRAFRTAALAAVAASGVQAFSPAAPSGGLQLAGRATKQLRGAAGVSMQAETGVSRRDMVSGALASVVLAGSTAPAFGEMLKAACTTQSCPDAPDATYKIDTLAINKGKFTGAGYQFDRPSDEYFKRVQVFDRVTARPGSVLLRDKKNPDIAIFSNVEQIKNADFTWKPTIVEVRRQPSPVLARIVVSKGRCESLTPVQPRPTQKTSATNSSSSLRLALSRLVALIRTRSSMWWRQSWAASTRRCILCQLSRRRLRTCILSMRKPKRLTGRWLELVLCSPSAQRASRSMSEVLSTPCAGF